ncbi:MAG: helix-turn-helix transcriptional regulator [Oscillospiraceae bacterium]|nr:helix-turn-helix transcriptional regulator [Oscillospiraceae bacterium]
MVELSRKLRELRQANELTQKQVAERIGVTSSVVSAYENGIRLPSYPSLVKLAALFDVSSDYLLGITEKRARDSQHLISLDGLTPAKIALVTQLVDALRE